MEILDFESAAIYPGTYGLSTCYMSRPCFGALACSGLVAGRGLLLEIRGERRRSAAETARTAQADASRCSRSPRCAARSARAAVPPIRSEISRAPSQLVDEARAPGPGARGRCRVAPLLAESRCPAHLDAQEELKANLLADIYKEQLSVGASASARRTSRRDPASCGCRAQVVERRPPRSPAEPPKVIDDRRREGRRVRRDRRGRGRRASRSTDPVAAGKAAVAELRKQGAQVVIGARAGVDEARCGQARARHRRHRLRGRRARPRARPSPIGSRSSRRRSATAGWSCRRIAARSSAALDVYAARRRRPLADAVGAARRARRSQQLDKQLAALDADLAKFRPMTRRRSGVRRAEAGGARRSSPREREQLEGAAAGRAGDAAATSRSIRSGSTRRSRAACRCRTRSSSSTPPPAKRTSRPPPSKPVPPPPKGSASYVGMRGVRRLPQRAVDFWKKTVHAQAWKTLVDRGQQFDYDCIGCHVTGWEQAGRLEPRAQRQRCATSQCETCHGPGSIHVAKGGEEKPLAIDAQPAARSCARRSATRKEHTDTFQREAVPARHRRARATARSCARSSATGRPAHELRKAALDKAGRTLGAGCTR